MLELPVAVTPLPKVKLSVVIFKLLNGVDAPTESLKLVVPALMVSVPPVPLTVPPLANVSVPVLLRKFSVVPLLRLCAPTTLVLPAAFIRTRTTPFVQVAAPTVAVPVSVRPLVPKLTLVQPLWILLI